MYKLQSIEEYGTTRVLILENVGTGRQERCFDDSLLLDFNNFEFMKVGNSYQCKILLVGKVDSAGELFTYLGKERVGSKNLLKLAGSDQSLYYLDEGGVWYTLQENQSLMVSYSRKDLIQVEEILHPSLR